MEITLRKANAIQASINEALKELDLSTEVVINEFEDPKEKIEVALVRFTTNEASRTALYDALFDIRAKVAQANATSGINDVLAEVARTEKTIGFYNRLGNLPEVTALRVLNGKLKKIGEREGRDAYYHRDEDVSTTFFSGNDIDNFATIAKNAKKAKVGLQDKLLELNVSTRITLADASVTTLSDNGIL